MTEPTTPPGADGRSITITRVFDAPRELMWTMFTDPEHFRHWFGGGPPMDVPSDKIAMDVRPDGEWTATMVQADGSELPFGGRYREVVEPERLVFTFETLGSPERSPTPEVATVLLTDVGGKTEVSLTQAGYMPPEEYAVGLKNGYGTFFDALERHLAAL
jgi:uncharacterized protein YndB with AHSA1/START domain